MAATVSRQSVSELIKKHKEIVWPDDPKFNKASRYDWRNYVPEDIQTLWPSLGLEARTVVFVMAEKAANDWMSRAD